MPSRAIRRAAAHQALEAARKSASVPSTVAEPAPATTVSDAQLAANRANAQLSSGPKTGHGKLASSHNALKTGLTGRTILLPSDDVAAYQSLVSLINHKFAPANGIEKHLVQTIADTEWRLLRIPTLESGLYALGRMELAAECADVSNHEIRANILEALVFRAYEKHLRNLALQERRLRNQLKADTAELRRLQQERLETQTALVKEESPAQPKPTALAPANGFEFSTSPVSSVRAPAEAPKPHPTPQTLEAAA
jgi:hypothetical protein